MISRKAITQAFEIVMEDRTVSTAVVFCNWHREAVRVHKHEGGNGIHKGTYLVQMGPLFPEEKAFITRHRKKFGQSSIIPPSWIRYS
jgi:hypothetical protein